MKLCTQCSHFNAAERSCGHERNLGPASPVDGIRRAIHTPQDLREDWRLCGAEGLWWKPVPVEATPKRRGRPPKVKA